jgi:hypothetical protein
VQALSYQVLATVCGQDIQQVICIARHALNNEPARVGVNLAQVYLCPRRAAVLALDAPKIFAVIYDEVVRRRLGQGDRYVEPIQVNLAIARAVARSPLRWVVLMVGHYESKATVLRLM